MDFTPGCVEPEIRRWTTHYAGRNSLANQRLLQKPSRVATPGLGHCPRCLLGHDPTAGMSTLGAQVDDPVGSLDDVEALATPLIVPVSQGTITLFPY